MASSYGNRGKLDKLWASIKAHPYLYLNCSALSVAFISLLVIGNPVDNINNSKNAVEKLNIKQGPNPLAIIPKNEDIKLYSEQLKVRQQKLLAAQEKALNDSKPNNMLDLALPVPDIEEMIPPAMTLKAGNTAEIPENAEIIDLNIGKGGTLGKTFKKLGLSNSESTAAINALSPIFNVRRLRPENRISAVKTDYISRITLIYGMAEQYQLSRSEKDGEWTAKRLDIATKIEHKVIHGKVISSLYQALADANESAGLASVFADIFSWEIDFFSEVRSGDEFNMVVERELVNDQVIPGSTVVLAASYNGAVGNFQAYRQSRKVDAYYDEQGNSVRKAFLRAPLQFARVTSNYGNRNHPVLGYTRKHNGIDYRAPIGTPVLSVAAGTVSEVNNQPNGAGKYVKIRYPNGYEGVFMHLSRANVKKGQHVEQKQVIAFSGNTGISTGPHLHYGLKKNGQYVNPANEKFPRGNPLAKTEKSAFQQVVAQYQPLLKATNSSTVNLTATAGLEE